MKKLMSILILGLGLHAQADPVIVQVVNTPQKQKPAVEVIKLGADLKTPVQTVRLHDAAREKSAEELKALASDTIGFRPELDSANLNQFLPALTINLRTKVILDRRNCSRHGIAEVIAQTARDYNFVGTNLDLDITGLEGDLDLCLESE